MLIGDYNVVPTDFDIYPTTSWNKDALLQPESRQAFQRLLQEGWTDAIRALHPEDPMYTFWITKGTAGRAMQDSARPFFAEPGSRGTLGCRRRG
jgi:exonuclease III